MTYRTLQTVVFLAIAGLLAACGGETALSQEDFISQAEEICASSNEDLDSIGEELTADSTDEEVEDVAVQAADTIEGAIDQIRELGAPEGTQDELNAILDDTTAALDELREDPVGMMERGEDPLADVSDRLSAFGLEECGG